MAEPYDPIQCNHEVLSANGDPSAADALLRRAIQICLKSMAFVNLGLALMQQGLVDQAERATDWHCVVTIYVFDAVLQRILASFCYGAATTNRDGTGMANALKGKTSKPTSGVAIL